MTKEYEEPVLICSECDSVFGSPEKLDMEILTPITYVRDSTNEEIKNLGWYLEFNNQEQ